uniref:Uncharacterized protein n=1 Tax=Spironucleus salmonicida TaxID=348837 RepID=V6LGT1_9EUKA|eukprot:EST42916.1 Hypothetical protein SS50377_17451 [Spironucleus salmonicida]
MLRSALFFVWSYLNSSTFLISVTLIGRCRKCQSAGMRIPERKISFSSCGNSPFCTRRALSRLEGPALVKTDIWSGKQFIIIIQYQMFYILKKWKSLQAAACGEYRQ